MSLVGFCAGVVSVPILLLVQSEKLFTDAITILFVIVAGPITGLLNGLLFGVLGFPLYIWITRRVNLHTYSGEFEVLKKDATEI